MQYYNIRHSIFLLKPYSSDFVRSRHSIFFKFIPLNDWQEFLFDFIIIYSLLSKSTLYQLSTKRFGLMFSVQYFYIWFVLEYPYFVNERFV